MSLAATLAASGMRPASFLPTIKCSNCGDEIEIQAMGDHECAPVPLSPSTASASASNPFNIRPAPANETRPAQPSPLQFSTDEEQRPRAPTASSMQKPTRPVLPRINSAAANQPFLGTASQTPLSPASSIRSGGSSRSGDRAKKPRSATNPAPRIFDPRPPSPELTGNMDCAFPPFPVTPATPSSRKGSTASRSSRKASSLDPRHAKDGRGENALNRSSTRRSGTTDSSSRRSSKEDRSPPQSRGSDRRPSQNGEALASVDEHPIPPPTIIQPLDEPSQTLSTSPELLSPVSQPSNPIPHPLSAISQTSSTSSNFWSAPSQPLSANSAYAETPLSPTFSTSNQSLERKPSSEKGSTTGLRSISGTIRSALGRMPSRKGRNKQPNADEPPPSMPEAPINPLEHRPSQRKAPPQRPARPQEGLPDDLLHPMSGVNMAPQTLSQPSPMPLQDIDRSKTLPIMSPRSLDEALAPPKISKMPSEPALRSKGGLTASVQPEIYLPQDENPDDTRMDYRMTDAPPVPKPVQHHRSDSFHKSSDSGDSTASSRSLGNMSLNNSNTTSGTSPVVSVANSIDIFRQSKYGPDRSSADDGMRVAALNIKPHPQPVIPSEPVEEESTPEVVEDAPAFDEAESEDESATPPIKTPPANKSWPLESPMDPALSGGLFPKAESPSPASPVEQPFKPQLAPDSPKLERLSSDVYDPKRAFTSNRTSERISQSRPRSKTSGDADFRGFNFGTSPSPVEESDRARSPAEQSVLPDEPSEVLRKDSEASADGVTQSIPPPPPVPSENEAERIAKLARRGTTGHKGACRGCRKPIEGKSVKAADGRLTGRWHKACFTCFACRQPFETADFYVIDNLPYCEQHYHERNGSVCHGCRRGIEGEFLETTSGPLGAVVRKFHKRCFTCVECRMVLSDDYFEIGGRVHCERHALAAMRSQARRAPPGAPGGPSYPGSRLRAESFKTAQPRRPRLAPNPA